MGHPGVAKSDPGQTISTKSSHRIIKPAPKHCPLPDPLGQFFPPRKQIPHTSQPTLGGKISEGYGTNCKRVYSELEGSDRADASKYRPGCLWRHLLACLRTSFEMFGDMSTGGASPTSWKGRHNGQRVGCVSSQWEMCSLRRYQGERARKAQQAVKQWRAIPPSAPQIGKVRAPSSQTTHREPTYTVRGISTLCSY